MYIINIKSFRTNNNSTVNEDILSSMRFVYYLISETVGILHVGFHIYKPVFS